MAGRSGQVALIIGGSGALGGAAALRLATEGADIGFTYLRSAERANAIADRIEALGARCHYGSVAIEDADALGAFIESMVSTYGRIDTLIYAGGPSFDLAVIAKTSPAEWGRVIDSDLKGCFNAVHLVLSHLRRSQGSIVAITAAGVERAIARDILSLAPKAAITALIRGVALEEGRFGIRANCVAPGYIAGGIGKAIMEAVGEETATKLLKALALRRMGTVEEVADAVAYLSSDRASYITGTTIFVSGGLEL